MSTNINFDKYLSTPSIPTPQYTATPGISVPTNVYGYTPTPQDEIDLDQYIVDDDSDISSWESYLRATGQGLTFGFEDEIRGGVLGGYDALTTDQSFGDAYTTRRDEIRSINDAAREANPAAYLAGELTGGIVSGVAAAPLTGGASFASGATRMAATLGAQGAVAGLGYSEAEDLGGMAQDAAIGGTVGSLGGTAAAYGLRQLGRAIPTEKIAQGTRGIGQSLVRGAERAAGKRLIPDPVPEMAMDKERVARLGRWAMNNKVFNKVSSPEDLQRNVVRRTDDVYEMMFSPENPFQKSFKAATLSTETLENVQDEVADNLKRIYGNRFDFDQIREPMTTVSNRVLDVLKNSDGNSRLHLEGLIKLQKELARNIDFTNPNPSIEEIVYRHFFTKYDEIIADSIENKSTKALYNTFLNAANNGSLSDDFKRQIVNAHRNYVEAVRENTDMLKTALDTMTASSIASRAPTAGETLVGQTAAGIGAGVAGTGLGYLGGSGLGTMFPEYQNELQTIGSVVGGALGGVSGAMSDKVASASGRLASNVVDKVSIQGRNAVGRALGGVPSKTINTITPTERIYDLYSQPVKLRERFGKFAGVLQKAKERGQHNFAVTYQALFNQSEEFRNLVRNSEEDE